MSSPNRSVSVSSAYVVTSTSCWRTASIPSDWRKSTAAPKPIASVIGGVPASNLAGTGAAVNPSRRTSAIMLPPPRNGGVASSSSGRPHSAPMPDGPHILWLEKAAKSAPHACTSVALCGTYWQASTTARAPAAWAAAHSSVTGVSVPSTLLIAVTETTLAPSTRRSRSVRSSWPSAVSGIQRNSMPRSAASWCQGTMLAWCSMCVSTTTSPGERLARPHEWTTRLSASVAFLVNTISSAWPALTKPATLARAAS